MSHSKDNQTRPFLNTSFRIQEALLSRTLQISRKCTWPVFLRGTSHVCFMGPQTASGPVRQGTSTGSTPFRRVLSGTTASPLRRKLCTCWLLWRPHCKPIDPNQLGSLTSANHSPALTYLGLLGIDSEGSKTSSANARTVTVSAAAHPSVTPPPRRGPWSRG